MKLKSLFLYIFVLISFSSCQFNQLIIDESKKNLFSLDIENSIPVSFEQKLKFIFNSENNKNKQGQILLKNYIFSNYDIYGGPSLRSLEGELRLEIDISIYANKQISRKLVVYKRYKSNELNPFAQEQMIKALESEMQNELIKEIIFEVNAFEM